MKTKHIVYILLGLGFLALVAYRIMDNSNAAAAMGPRANVTTTVDAMVLKPQDFAENLSLSGTLEANEQVDLRSEISGVVEKINFKEGAKVGKGQVLFTVNDLELRAKLAKVKTAEKLAAENERRAQLLLEKEAISQEEYEVAMANFQSARAESQLTAAQLSKASVRAPFSGTIGLRYISEGTYVTPSTHIAKLVNLDRVKLTFSIPEKYASQVELGSDVTFNVAGSSKPFTASIYATEPGVDLATRTLKMRAMADNQEGKLISGTFASVNLPLTAVDDAIMVPTHVLIPIQNGKKMFVYKNGLAQEVEVETGARTKDQVRVISGVSAGDTILTSGVMILKDGAPVNIQMQQPVVNN